MYVCMYNVDWKAECDQLNLAHVARNKNEIEETETKTNASAHLVQYRFTAPAQCCFLFVFCNLFVIVW